MAKTYKQLQDDAELLGIKQNQSTDKLVAAINEATTPEEMGKLVQKITELGEQLSEVKPGAHIGLDDIVAKIDELHAAQLADRNVHTDPYLTGMANDTLVVRGIVTGEDVDEDKLLKPITQVDVGGAKIPTQRERLIKAAGMYVTVASGNPMLRSGLTGEQIKKADEIMVALGGKAGVYVLPKE